MGTKAHGNVISGRFEPTMEAQFLRGCRSCGSPHPLAMKPPQNPCFCPGCGKPAAKPGETRFEGAAITGVSAMVAGTFLSLGRWLHRAAKGI